MKIRVDIGKKKLNLFPVSSSVHFRSKSGVSELIIILAVIQIMSIRIAQIRLHFLAKTQFLLLSIESCIEIMLQKHFTMSPKITSVGVLYPLYDVSPNFSNFRPFSIAIPD